MKGCSLSIPDRYLALMEWAHYMKQMLLFTIAVDIFFPAGISNTTEIYGLALSSACYFLKMLFMAVLMALIESSRAKMRFFQLPSLAGRGLCPCTAFTVNVHNDGEIE